jgi:hypothetical protein
MIFMSETIKFSGKGDQRLSYRWLPLIEKEMPRFDSLVIEVLVDLLPYYDIIKAIPSSMASLDRSW